MTEAVVIGVMPADGGPEGVGASADQSPRMRQAAAAEAGLAAAPQSRAAGARAAVASWLRRPGLRLRTSRGVRVHYPSRFRLLMSVVCAISLVWVGNYLGHVLPTIEAHAETPCEYSDSQLTYNAKMLFVYFLWFAMARLSLFSPCIASRVAFVQSRTHGFCRTYCVHLIIRDGPLYIFVVGSLLFWFHLAQADACRDRSPVLYSVLQEYAVSSCLTSFSCLLLAFWHNRLLVEATWETESSHVEDGGAPTGTIEKLRTVGYDAQLFGEEEGKPYPSECAICLARWENDDVIKVTHCQHVFHQECLGNWLRSARTCALCRQDVTPLPRSPRGVRRDGSSPVGAE